MNQEISRSEYSQSEKLSQIGAYLQDIRHEQSLSIEQVATKTMIQGRLLRAIEAGNLDGLPEAIYVRGFIKRYAEFLGLNGNEVARSFPLYPDTGNLEPTWQNSDVAQLRQTHLYLAYVALITVAVIGLGAVLTRLNNGDRPNPNSTVVEAPAPDASESSSPQATEDSTENVASESGSDQPEESSAVEQKPEAAVASDTEGSDAASTAASENENPANEGDSLSVVLQPSVIEDDLLAPTFNLNLQDKPVQVELELKDRSWLRVIVDGKQDFEGVLPEGTQRTWAGESTVVVRAGNAGGVLASLNGSEAEPMGNPGAVSERSFSSESIGPGANSGR